MHRTARLLCVCVLVPSVVAHIRLTWPPARFPALDFLDNTRTPPPCGVPKPNDKDATYTSLPAGTRLNINWFMSYPHQGGYRVQLLDEQDRPIRYLTAADGSWTGSNDQTKQTATIQLPTEPCDRCTLRLERQANEWGTYSFWSCADVDIVNVLSGETICNGHGQIHNGTCYCDKLYSGERCQYKDECWGDEDCFSNGLCIQVSQYTHPRGVCFCNLGFYGPNCALVSAYQSTDFDAAQYKSKQLSSAGDKMYWRILKDTDEIEVVLQYKTMSWMGVGWKPANYNGQCQILKKWQDKSSEVEIIEEPLEQYPDYGASVPAEPDQTPPPLPPTTRQSTAPPTTTTTTPATTTPTTTTPATTTGDSRVQTLTLQPEAGDRDIFAPSLPDTPPRVLEEREQVPPGVELDENPSTTTTTTQAAQQEPQVVEDANAVVGDVCYGDWRWPPNCLTGGGGGGRACDYRVSWHYLDQSDEIEFSIETKAPRNWWTGVGFSKQQSMAGADMIVVKSFGERMTLHDMFAEGYGVPREDDVTNVYTPTIVGTHVNGVMRATFMRKRKTNDTRFDAQFGDNDDADCYYLLMPVTGGRLNADGTIDKHLAPPKITAQKICMAPCATAPTAQQPEEPVSSCMNEFRFPTGCEGRSCQYVARWDYSAARGDVRFEISSVGTGRWTGIGISADGGMTNSDIYTGWVYEGQAYIMDRFAYGRQQPAMDPGDRQDIYDIGGKIVDDVQTIWFRREVISPDELTDYSLDKCWYFIFPVGGGRVLARQARDFQDPTAPIGYHDLYRPRSSKERICLCDASGVPIGQSTDALRLRARAKRQTPLNPFAVDLQPQPEAEAAPVPEPEHHPEPEPSHHVQRPRFHPMDCTDMVIGAAVGTLSRIEDYWSVSRATPMLDQYYGGYQSITSAAGSEADGITTLIFRKKMTSYEPTDHNITDTAMNVIWAKGQQSGKYHHRTPSGLDVGGSSVKDYYEIDFLMYHGSKNRGSVLLNLMSETPDQVSVPEPPRHHGNAHPEPRPEPEIPTYPEPEPESESQPEPSGACGSAFRYPRGCRGAACTYNVQWTKDEHAVHFDMETSIEHNQWTGIGFNDIPSMMGADLILIMVHDDGSVEIGDQHAVGHTAPQFDQMQDVFNPMYSYANSRLRVKFSRPLSGSSQEQTDANLNECQYFLYPVHAGPLTNGAIAIHTSVPLVSPNKVCVHKCGHQQPGAEPEAEPELPTGHHYPEPEPGYHHPEPEPGYHHPEPEPGYHKPKTEPGYHRPEPEPGYHHPKPEPEGKYVVPETEPEVHAEPKKPYGEPEGIPEKKLSPKPDASVQIAGGGLPAVVPRHYDSTFKIMNELWDDTYSDINSERYQKLEARIMKALQKAFGSRYGSNVKLRLRSLRQGSVIADVEVVLEENAQQSSQSTSDEIAEVIRAAVQQEFAEQQLDVDPASVTTVPASDMKFTPEEIRNFIIIGVAVLLVLIAIIFAICMILRTKRRRTTDFSQYPYGGGYYAPGMIPTMKHQQATMQPATQGGAKVAPQFDNGTYMTEKYTQNGGAHNRQFSQATTATPPGAAQDKPGSSSPGSSDDKDSPAGVGQTTYAEWSHKVASNAQTHQESNDRPRTAAGMQQQAPIGAGPVRPASHLGSGPYVQYPNDPYSIYTIGGQSRQPRGAMPPYHRPY